MNTADDDRRIHEALMVCCQNAPPGGSLELVRFRREGWRAYSVDSGGEVIRSVHAASPEGALIALAKELQA